ncbi:caspase family protein [Niveibacterium microcysteis]|uniref:Caspase family protein n=1 Tax=Niveibacterium microcysteis TaxID=2811415 RepID=A0ABX7MBK5_9RHOO|nr:caspase family protein [Niveibacterium microcysteis]QSI78256.1 caspase family protein [Niveibacterium microcysteis]
MGRIAKSAFGVVLALLIPLMPAQAREMRALIVGVSEYPSLAKNYQLEGPRNDVQRLRDILQQRGFAPRNITLLADGVAGASGLPTRAAILAGLDSLATQSAKGDYVLLYFSGHGSQEPADRNTPEGREEPDGLFEIFLPRDIGKWDESDDGGKVQNALVDFEIRRAVDRIIDKGAFVWGVFDSCHSATLVRGADDSAEIRYRHISPQALGVPGKAMDRAEADAVHSRGKSDAAAPDPFASAKGQGGGVFFYAAQTTELAPEMRLPLGHPDRKPFGLFGFTLMQALESGAVMTYRQLAQYVLSQYGGMNQTRVTPLFSGTQLDAPVLGQDAVPIQQWKLDRTATPAIPAGALSRITEGSLFAIVANPLDKTESAIGYAEAHNVALSSSALTFVAQNGKPVLDPKEIPAAAHARLLRVAGQYQLRVVVDTNACEGNCPALAPIVALQKSGIAGAQIEWLKAPDAGDVAIVAFRDRVMLVPPALQGVSCKARKAAAERQRCEAELRSGSLTLAWKPEQGGDALRETLATALHGVARATNLMRIASQLTERNGGGKLAVSMKQITRAGKVLPLSAERSPVLHAGDKVEVSLLNEGQMPLDVTVLYLDASYGVSALFPYGGASNRLEAKASYSFEIDINDDTTGLERLVTIAVQARNLGERADFSFLAQSPIEQLDRTRGVEDDDVTAFRDAGFADYTTRGVGAPKTPGDRTSMQVFNWTIQK